MNVLETATRISAGKNDYFQLNPDQLEALVPFLELIAAEAVTGISRPDPNRTTGVAQLVEEIVQEVGIQAAGRWDVAQAEASR